MNIMTTIEMKTPSFEEEEEEGEEEKKRKKKKYSMMMVGNRGPRNGAGAGVCMRWDFHRSDRESCMDF